jgi:hypothetical protein
MLNRFKETQAMLEEPLAFGSASLSEFKRQLPEAYKYWASAPRAAEILHQYSNTDNFWFTPKVNDIVSTDAGDVLLFSRESQGNFQLGVLLDSDESDPPVYYSDFHENRWTLFCERFSEAIFTQIFDWQYRLKFDERWGEWQIDYYKHIPIPFRDNTLPSLCEWYTQHPTTHWFFETPFDTTTWRFSTPDDERILFIHYPVPAGPGHCENCWLEVYAPLEDRECRVKSLAAELKHEFL